MPRSFNFAGIQLHVYGLIVAIAVLGWWYATEFLLHRHFKRVKLHQQILLQALVVAVLGARTWHVLTDWYLYHQNWIGALYIWEGGLSIIGAMLAAFGWIWFQSRRQSLELAKIFDLVALTLPLAQAVGRLGNYVNNELYGAPTTLPWGLKVPGLVQTVHPLFAYEMVGNCFVWLGLWQLYRKKGLGSGKVFSVYVIGYGTVRFFLDFLRVDPAYDLLGLGINQWIALAAVVAAVGWLSQNNRADEA